MFNQLKQIILGLYQAHQLADCKRKADAMRQRNKRKPVSAYSSVQRLNGKIWESQFINDKRGVN